MYQHFQEFYLYGAGDQQRQFQLIQTVAGEEPSALLDAVMLVSLPVMDKNDKPVKGSLGGSGMSGDLALVRNPSFAGDPDMSSGKPRQKDGSFYLIICRGIRKPSG